MAEPSSPWIHPTALVEEGVSLGPGTKVWDGVHIRRHARIGRSCIIGEKTYIACGVEVGDCVKINASVYLCARVRIEDFVMISAHTVFTNEAFPRAGNPGLTGLQTSEPREETLATRVSRGASIGANATIGPGLTLGEFCMVGMGSVVTGDVPPHALVAGNPARLLGHVCCCGHPLFREAPSPGREEVCPSCGRSFVLDPEGPRLQGEES